MLATFAANPAAADGAVNSLRWAVDQANASSTDDIVSLAAGTYTLTMGEIEISDPDGTTTIESTSGDTDVTIQPSAGNPDRIFRVATTQQVNFQDLIVTGGSATEGGAFFLTGTTFGTSHVAIIDSEIHSNTSTSHGGAIFVDFVKSHVLEITNSTIRDNVAGGSGGAIYVEGSDTGSGTVNITDSLIQDNSAQSGGGAFADWDTALGAVWTLDNTIVEGNSATVGDGGGIVMDGGELHVTQLSEIRDNTAAEDGGGVVLISRRSRFTLNNSSLLRNEAGDNGGGVIAGEAFITIENNSVVAENTAGMDGGGIASFATFVGGSVEINDSTIEQNEATNGTGGGLYARGFADIRRSTFDQNLASSADAFYMRHAFNVDSQNDVIDVNVQSSVLRDEAIVIEDNAFDELSVNFDNVDISGHTVAIRVKEATAIATDLGLTINGVNSGEFGQVVVESGVLDLDSGNLELTIGGFTLPENTVTELVLIENIMGSVNGQFSGIPEGQQISSDFGGTGFNAFLTYVGGTGDDVVISAEPPFSVASSTPNNIAQNVSPASNIVANFTPPDNVNGGTVDDGTFVIHAKQSGRITNTFGVVDRDVTANPNNNFHAGEVVQVSVTTTVEDVTGETALSSIWQFRVAAALSTGVMTDTEQSLVGTYSGHEKLAAGDLDGDGHLDLLAINSLDYGTVFLNDGSGNFSSGHTFSNYAQHVALGDVDGDGDLDAVFSYQGTISVFKNDGAASFSSHQDVVVSDSKGIDLGDIDGDGDLDMLVAKVDGTRVLRNNGMGTFADTGQSLHNGAPFNPYDQQPRLGDLDGDGDLDAFVATLDSGHGVFINDGSGTFTNSGQQLGFVDPFGPRAESVALGDLDGDGDLDAIVVGEAAAYSSPLQVWQNDGDATFSEGFSLPLNSPPSNASVRIGDVDGDGDLDAIVSESTLTGDSTNIWLNDGAGTLTDSGQSLPLTKDSAIADFNGDGGLDVAFSNTYDGYYGTTVWLNEVPEVDFGDAPDTTSGTGPGDYKTTAADGGPSHDVVPGIMLGAAIDGTEGGTLQNVTANADDVDGALPDDEDGLLDPIDLMATEGTAPSVTLLATNNTGSDATLHGWIDYNADGVFDNTTEHAEIAVPDTSTDVRFTLPFPTIPAGSAGSTYARFRLSTDSAAADPTGHATDGEVEDYVFKISKTTPGVVADVVPIASGLNGGPTLTADDLFGRSIVELGDVDGDGIRDLAVGAPGDDTGGAESGAVYLLLMNTDGTVKTAIPITHQFDGGSTYAAGDAFGTSVAGIGDLDGDGIPDLAVGATGDYYNDGFGSSFDDAGAVFILRLNSDGTVKAAEKIGDGVVGKEVFEYSDYTGRGMVGLGDLDGDGIGDLAVGAPGNQGNCAYGIEECREGAVHMLFLNSDGTLKNRTTVTDSANGGPTLGDYDRFGYSVTSLGDLDGDGIPEIAVGAPFDDTGGMHRGAVHVLFLNADGSVKSASSKKIASDTGGGPTLSNSDSFGRTVESVGDLDGDGVNDLLVGTFGASDFLLLLNPDGTAKSVTPADNFLIGAALLCDLNGDGIRDLAVEESSAGGGEIEVRFLTEIPTDYGDAPDDDPGPPNFPTFEDSDGARHLLGSGLFFGSSVDADLDGQPDATATGDDSDENNDDDGLTLNTMLVPGQPVSFSLEASAPGLVDAWIDIDGDGTWSHPDEQVLASEPVGAGSNDFSLLIPADAAFGNTFVRVRISSAGGLSPTGMADDGEVEDHQVTIETVNRFLVNSVGDLGDNNPGDGLCDTGGLVGGNPECTLRAALEETKALPNLPAGPDVIIFDIVGGGPHTISPSSLLPAVTDPVVVDGTTESDFAGTPVIELDGSGAGATTRGLFVSTGGDGSTIRGLAINRFGSDGVLIANADGVVLEGNHIGTDPLGTAPRANARGVVLSGATNTMIGGTTAEAGNTISGNSGIGVLMTAGSNNNTVQGNRIGVASNGMAGLANGGTGIKIQGSSTGNTIGGATAGAGNILSGNSGHGVFVSGSAATGNAVLGNLIGTNATATAAIGNTQNGVFFSGAPGNTIGGAASGAGNAISGNSIGVLLIGNSTGTTVQGNAIGANPAGVVAIPNRTGVVLSAASNAMIGGSAPGAGNLISGNTGVGVLLTASSNNTLQGNLIGTAIDGETPLANGGTGLRLQVSSTNNTIGGASSGAGNTISGNGGHGVVLANGGTTGNTIAGNQIGIDRAGTTAAGNAQSGVFVSNSPGNTIGGTAAGADNTISGNSVHGILLTRTGTTNTVVAGNRIGSDATGSNPVPNLVDGIFILNSPDNTIGGAALGAGNLVTASGVHGVVVSGLVSTGNTISANSIFGNTLLGIDLDTAPADPGRTANDAGDADAGPNNVQNFPVITAAELGSGTLDVTFSVDSTTGNSAYDLNVEFFLADSLHGEGQTFLDAVTYTAANAGLAVMETITIPAGVTVNIGDQVLATATDANGNTSEFSLSRTVAAPLLAAGGQRSQASSVESQAGVESRESRVESQSLNQDVLQPVVEAAIVRLQAAGLAADLFTSINVTIADLPGATLGLATPTSIVIDANAAGYGWYVSPESRDMSQEPEDSDAYNPQSAFRNPQSIDLLTVVMHELGHVVGLDDLSDPAAEDDLMFGWLEPGVRKTSLEVSLADEAFADF